MERRLGGRAVAWGLRAELELAARAELGHRPGQAVLVDNPAEALGQTRRQGQHVGVGGIGHHLFQVGAHTAHRQGVGRQRGTHAAVAVAFALLAGTCPGQLHGAGHRRAATIHRARYAAGDRLAEGDEVRLELPGAGTAARTCGDGVGLVDDQQRAVTTGQLAQLLVEAGLRQDHADVGHRRLAEHGGHVFAGQRPLQGLEVVERHRAAELGEVVGLAEQAGAMHGAAVAAANQSVVDRAVVATVEYQHHLTTGDRTRPAQDEAVGVGGGGRYLPERQAEALRQQLACDDGILPRKHGGQAVRALLGERPGDRRRRMAEHAAGIAQAEVHVGVAVHIMETRAVGTRHEQRTGC